MKTHLIETPLPGLWLVQIDYFRDERGFFIESWHRRDFAAAGLDAEFVQEGHSGSAQRVLRGLHYQNLSAPMGKLVRCSRGAIFDVAVDLRVSSPTFGRWFGIELNAENHRQLFVPVGFAHGFVVLSPTADVQYKQTGFYTPSAEGSLAWNDPDIGIQWPLGEPVLSVKDQNAERFREYQRHAAFP